MSFSPDGLEIRSDIYIPVEPANAKCGVKIKIHFCYVNNLLKNPYFSMKQNFIKISILSIPGYIKFEKDWMSSGHHTTHPKGFYGIS